MRRLLSDLKGKGSVRRFGRKSAKVDTGPAPSDTQGQEAGSEVTPSNSLSTAGAPPAPEDVDDLKKLGKECSDLAALAITDNWEALARRGIYWGDAEEFRNDWLNSVRDDLRTTFVPGFASKHDLWRTVVSGRWNLVLDPLSLEIPRPNTRSRDERDHYHVAVLQIRYNWRSQSESNSIHFIDSYEIVILLPGTWNPDQEDRDRWLFEDYDYTDAVVSETAGARSLMRPEGSTSIAAELSELLSEYGISGTASLTRSADLSRFGLSPSGADDSTSLTN